MSARESKDCPTFTTAIGGAFAGLLCAAAPALAGAPSQTATVPAAATDWSRAAAVGQFDPSLGTLQTISLGLTGTLQGTIGVESLDMLPRTAGGAISSTITLFSPGGGPVLSVTPAVGAGANLAAFDGALDFAGASGRTFSGLSNTQSANSTFTVGAPGPQIATAPFIGAGTVALPVTASASANVFGPLDLAARTQAAAGAIVDVHYGAGSAHSGGGTTAGIFDSTSFGSFGLGQFGVQHTAVQVQTLSDQRGSWARDVTFDRFDPSLGTLVSADLTLLGDVNATLSVQDTGPTAGSYNVSRSVTFNLLRPDGTSLDSAVAASTASGSLAPFAGIDDFSKPFGATTADTFSNLFGAISAGSATDLALFSGSNPLTLELDAIGALSASLPSSADLLSSALEGARVSLSYTYLPGPISTAAQAAAAVTEPGSLALLSISLAGFGLFRRRQ